MDALTILRGFARNNAWANYRLYVACAGLSHEELHATRTSFFPTIMKTLNHNLIVDWYYVDALAREGRGRTVFDGGDEPFSDFSLLRDSQGASDKKLVALADGLVSDELERVVDLERDGHVQQERLGDVLQHLFQHQIHHRGQIHAMLAGTRVRPPQLDEFFMREELPLRRRELEELGLPVM
jgi:uncharacterized damage-inducible protein DinB